MDMIYVNLLCIPLNTALAVDCKGGWIKALNVVAVILNIAVVAGHLAKASV